MNINEYIGKKYDIRFAPPLPFVGNITRDQFGELFNELGYKIGAEVGVAHGIYSESLFKSIPDLKMYCIDRWDAFGRRSERMMESRYQNTVRRLSPYNATLIRKTSMDALNDIPDNSLDFVYIDAAHDFCNVMMDVICWSNKVRKGGIVAGHDYIISRHCGVIPAVMAYTTTHSIAIWFITSDFPNSWFWVK